MQPAPFEFQYRLKTRQAPIGGQTYDIRCLESLDGTIDDLFDYLKRDGRESMLEDLCPYFGVVWPAALGLALKLADEPALFQGKKAIEIGCGLALPSLVVSRLGGDIVATDMHPAVPEFLERNLALNDVPSLRYETLNWIAEDARERLGLHDLVVGSDILYERRHLSEVPRAILRLLKPGGRAIVSDPGRPYLQAFVQEMEAAGFHSKTEVRSVPENDGNVREVFVIEFTPGVAFPAS
jgi:predicted nicotinamide N-methyase